MTGISKYLAILLGIQNITAQTVNTGVLTIEPNTDFSTFFAFDNKASGDVLHNGNFYAYSDFKNDGLFTYTDLSNGKTLFVGNSQQKIEGLSTSDFQNIEFDNTSAKTPFLLTTEIVINKLASFKNGIVDNSLDTGKVVFNENASHTDTSNLSFVDGRVEKKGAAKFEFPIGDVYYRPSLNDANSNSNNIYTTEYFFETIGNIHPYTSKEESIITIDEVEYWNLTQEQGTDKAVLSLTLDKNTTPAIFFQESDDTELAIVRWDVPTFKWINEKGVTTDLLTGAEYTKLVTTQVSGYSIFTIAIVKKENPEPPSNEIVIYNAVSPNGDGINDTFHIKGIDNFPDNKVEIYNRWGVKVYDAKSYNESDNMFRGYSEGRDTVKKNDGLPDGTYFYILEYQKADKTMRRSGYLYISKEGK
ncbi:gliding motility-associated C-terminal domain-containing protein [Flavobacterium phragmitis]|uniref:Gliding motility-associated C-terminal domain-containing protein n=1 Tax=Flavobacterium phragmitis TaxID=739143 RepID=A0A1I1TDP2_9FLAO|nr:gliding motility-associated C-terminal domain-containing protein [Flavobacterium phragmitis]SFD54433.1 gliding motility-associated C-terminal domain-containing protein [Flavobacterium phragmitis]